MAIKTVWQGGKTFISENENQHQIVLDASSKDGGIDKGFRPMDAVLSALAGCMGLGGLSIMRPFLDQVTHFEVITSGEREEQPPQSFTALHVTFSVDGNVDSHKVWRAIRLAEEKYCSVSNSLKAEKHLHVIINGQQVDET